MWHDEGVFTRLSKKYYQAIHDFEKLAHYLNLAYPAREDLKILRSPCSDELDMPEMHMAYRHALGSLPCLQLWSLGCFDSDGMTVFGALRNSTNATRVISKCFKHVDRERDFLFGGRYANYLGRAEHTKAGIPAFYLMKDRKRKQLVLCIRGTSNLHDVCTDLDTDTLEIPILTTDEKGDLAGTVRVHRGIYRSAQAVSKLCLPRIQRELRDNGDEVDSLLVTGLSLGAGVGQALAFLWRDEIADLKVYSFEAPCVFSREVAFDERYEKVVTNIVMGNDFVPRLSEESVRKFVYRLDFLNAVPGETKRKALEYAREGTPVDSIDDEDVVQMLHQLKSIDGVSPRNYLYPTGKIFWYVPKTCLNHDAKQRQCDLYAKKHSLTACGSHGSHYALCDGTPHKEKFQDLVIECFDSFLFHIPDRYLNAMQISLLEHDDGLDVLI